MRILVTGGAGFIGSHLCEELLARGHRVAALDNLSTGRLSNVAHLKGSKNFRLVVDTILNEKRLGSLIRESDMVYHLAAAVGTKLVVEDPVMTIETNVDGSKLVFQYAAKKRIPVVLASTSEVYGKNEKLPFVENDDMLLGPTHKFRWSYACSKAVDEFLALAYHKQKSLPVVVARLFNTVGPRQTGEYGMVLPRFVKSALRNEPIQVYGDGRQTRCFCYVKDVVGALVKLPHVKRAFGEVFNIGSNERITITELAHRVKKLLNPKSQITFVPYEKAYEKGFEDLRHRVPDINKINKLIGFKPSLNINQIILKVAEDINRENGLDRSKPRPGRSR